MRYLCLNPRALADVRQMHAHLRDELDFPPHYGMNLDALYDELTVLGAPTSILCLQYEQHGAPLYPHAEPFYRVIQDAAKANPHLRVDCVTLPGA